MTTLVLQGADAALGALAGAATTYVGNALAGAVAGGSGASTRFVEGPRLSEMAGVASTEGAPIPRAYGRVRLGGQLVWATRFEEVATTSGSAARSTRSGGKSLGGTARAQTATVSTTYAYYANLAVALCEGPVAFVRRIWADGAELDQTTLTIRVHRGGEDAEPDPLIVAKEGAGSAPAYRGTAYVVFERMSLAPFGNRVPQFSFEIVRAVPGLPDMIRSVCLIPGATEFGYDPEPVTRSLGLGASAPENVHQFQRPSDIDASLDALVALCPNLDNVALVVTWFGDDLRVGSCTIRPCVDRIAKTTNGGQWRVSGLSRAEAREVSQVGDASAYGGTPSDDGVMRAIAALKARGLSVTLYPFVMMDVPAGNILSDPWTGADGQPPYPWRGRITCDPAPGRPGTVDASAAAAAQVASFFGSAGAADFSPGGGTVTYGGPNEWSFRRLVLHAAHLAVAAGGVDAFVLGSELVGLTRVRAAPGSYPAVAALRALAGDVRSVVGAETRLVYAADWTEYGAHVLDGGAEVRFPLDQLFADPAVDAVGIDYYPPISDWRDGADHLDAAIASSPYDVDYLRDRLGGGEAFDWYYRDGADRAAQTRTAITDGAGGKPWTFRAKDLRGWWSNAHHERVGGIEIGPTAWQPGGKPIWLTEIGIPAVDKGANGPNVFPDPKSSESAYPPFSDGTRDDLMQARGLEAVLSRFDPALPGFRAADNPAAPVPGGRMVDPRRLSVWAWDARPYPAFPALDGVWADGANWRTGHWITGRLEGVPLDRLVAAILADFELEGSERPALDGFVDGYAVDRPMSARAALEPLGRFLGFDATATAGGIRWRGRGGRVDGTVAVADLVERGDDPLLSRSRAQETDLPAELRFGFVESERDFARASVLSRRLAGSSRRVEDGDFAVVTRREEAGRLADIALQDSWAGRDTARFRLSARRVDIEPGDVLAIETEGGTELHRVVRIVDGADRLVDTRAVEPAIFSARREDAPAPVRRNSLPARGPAAAFVLDLPAPEADPAPLQVLAVAADPWPGPVAIWREEAGGGFGVHRVADRPALIGRTLSACPAGPVWRWDDAVRLDVELSDDAVASVPDADALGGANLFAIETGAGWEIMSAARAELIGPRRYRLSRMLRGLRGTEAGAAAGAPSGARIVRLDEALVALADDPAEIGVPRRYRIVSADRDHADPSAVAATASPAATTLRPLSPVHLAARRTGEGVVISWIRRTRRGGDPWGIADVPLAEEDEAYRVEILADGAVRRVFAAAGPSVLYAAADENADFGEAQSVLAVRIAQVSAAVGPGEPASALLPVS